MTVLNSIHNSMFQVSPLSRFWPCLPIYIIGTGYTKNLLNQLTGHDLRIVKGKFTSSQKPTAGSEYEPKFFIGVLFYLIDSQQFHSRG